MTRPRRACAETTIANIRGWCKEHGGDAPRSNEDGAWPSDDVNFEEGRREEEEEEEEEILPVTPAVARSTRRRRIQPPFETEVVDLVSSDDEEMEAMVTDSGNEESSPDQLVTPSTRLFRRQRVVSPVQKTPSRASGSNINGAKRIALHMDAASDRDAAASEKRVKLGTRMNMLPDLSIEGGDEMEAASDSASECSSMEDGEEIGWSKEAEEEDTDVFGICKDVHFCEPDSIDTLVQMTKEEASARLGVQQHYVKKAVVRADGGAKAIKKIEHKDGSFQFVLHSQMQPEDQKKAQTVKELISGSVALVMESVSTSVSPKASEARQFLVHSSSQQYFLSQANTHGKALLNAVVEEKVPSVLEKLMETKVGDKTRSFLAFVKASWTFSPAIYLGIGKLASGQYTAYVGQADFPSMRMLEHGGNIYSAPFRPEQTSSLLYQKAKEVIGDGGIFRFFTICSLDGNKSAAVMDCFELMWITILQTFQGSIYHLQQTASFGIPIVPVIGLNAAFTLSGKQDLSPTIGINPELDYLGCIRGFLRLRLNSAYSITMLDERFSREDRRLAEERIAPLIARLESAIEQYDDLRRRLLLNGELRLHITKRPCNGDGYYYMVGPFFGLSINNATAESLLGHMELHQKVTVMAKLVFRDQSSPSTDFYKVLDPVRRSQVGGMGILLSYGNKEVYWQKSGFKFNGSNGTSRAFDTLKACDESDERKQRVAQAQKDERTCDSEALVGDARAFYLGTFCGSLHGNLLRMNFNTAPGRRLTYYLPVDEYLKEHGKQKRARVMLRLNFDAAVPLFVKFDRVKEGEEELMSRTGVQCCIFDETWRNIDVSKVRAKDRSAALEHLLAKVRPALDYWKSLTGGTAAAPVALLQRLRQMAIADVPVDNLNGPELFRIHTKRTEIREGHHYMNIKVCQAFAARHDLSTRPVQFHVPLQLWKQAATAFSLDVQGGIEIMFIIDTFEKTKEDSRILIHFVGGPPELWFNRVDFTNGKTLEHMPTKLYEVCELLKNDWSQNIGRSDKWQISNRTGAVAEAVITSVIGRPDFFNAREFALTMRKGQINLGGATNKKARWTLPTLLIDALFGTEEVPEGARVIIWIDAYKKSREQARILVQRAGSEEWYDQKAFYTKPTSAVLSKNFIKDDIWAAIQYFSRS